MSYPTFERDHFADIEGYEDAVISGTRKACKWERLAVKRHIDDLKKSANDDYPYYFDEARARAAIQIIECFPHVKGKWAKSRNFQERLISLSPWQKWLIACIFGWRNKADGLRRFTLIYICVPRKNGKSVLAAAICLIMLACDDEYGAEVYCGATTEKQAWEVFRPAKKMVKLQPLFAAKYKIQIHAKKLEIEHDGSRMEPVIGKPGDGASPSFWVADEYHEHETDDFVETMITGQGAREQGLGLIITTAGDNHEGPCFATEQELQSVLSASVNDDSFFGVIFTVDKGVPWDSDDALEMANPNLGISVRRGYLIDQRNKAKLSARKLATFKNKHLDVWVSAKDAWINPELWAKCKTPSNFDWGQFLGQECGLGGDLSESKDLTSFVKCFRLMIDGKYHYYFKSRNYTTELQLQEKKHYCDWVDDDFLFACDGAMIDYDEVVDDVEKDNENYQIERCFFDPRGAALIAQRIEKGLGIEAVRFEQTYTNFTQIVNDFDAMLLDGRIHYDGNQCYAWMMLNMVLQETRDGKGKRPIKPARDKKIDAGIATLLSFASMYIPDDEDHPESLYNKGEL